MPIEIPANASGRLSILVSDGRQLNAIEQRDVRRTLEPQTVTQLVRLLNDTRRNNRVYIRLLSGTPGAVVNGEAMAALPPSVLSVLESDRNGGSFTPMRSATVGEWELPMDSAVTGSRLLTIEVDSAFRPLMPPAPSTLPLCTLGVRSRFSRRVSRWRSARNRDLDQRRSRVASLPALVALAWAGSPPPCRRSGRWRRRAIF